MLKYWGCFFSPEKCLPFTNYATFYSLSHNQVTEWKWSILDEIDTYLINQSF